MRLPFLLSTLILSLTHCVAAYPSYLPQLAQRSRSTLQARADGLTFSNPQARNFYVDGKSLPEVDFDLGPSYAGLLPISGNKNETRKLFFWFFPPRAGGSTKDLVFWTNGGPGCSSLADMLDGTGPFTWSPGMASPTPNPWSWTNLSSVLWVEQPIGTGFTQGVPNIENEEENAKQVVGFLHQFLEVFSELKGKNFYLGGHSYAAMYVPYFANYIYDNPSALDLKLKGTWIGAPYFTLDQVHRQIPAIDFIHEYKEVLALSDSALAELEAKAEACGFAGFFDKYATYPPAGPLPNIPFTDECNIWDDMFFAAYAINPAFNPYKLFDTWPLRSSSLDPPTPYFDRQDVKKAIHAPLKTTWEACKDMVINPDGSIVSPVFPEGDQSPSPTLGVLPKVIEKNERTILVNGKTDSVVMWQGTRLVLQNMTWGGAQGFQQPIAKDSFLIDYANLAPAYGPDATEGSAVVYGTSHIERKLAYVEVIHAGHIIPQHTPWAAFQTMQYLLGLRSTP